MKSIWRIKNIYILKIIILILVNKKELAPGQNPTCDFFSGSTMGNYKGFTWQASRGKTAFPTSDLVHNQWSVLSEGSCSQELMSSRPTMSSCVPVLQAPLLPFGGLLVEGIWPKSFSGISVDTFSWGKGGES